MKFPLQFFSILEKLRKHFTKYVAFLNYFSMRFSPTPPKAAPKDPGDRGEPSRQDVFLDVSVRGQICSCSFMKKMLL